ncbi:hypothetical protein SJA_C2-04200 [Sphingobium indicum UT26S]|uniref:Uncharacterized protein n=1 Tax=Sphingobium indicum (strain DSM 16413 / CCM 7287 / MTCC 6362 / UT26 / NBRC 101211 / UT26S) TaxID=452662 RepID=D4Z8G4_SPHIU|nr:hypothetical protein SJA_C2-04200 [Sphingobium indicum UT26S]
MGRRRRIALQKYRAHAMMGEFQGKRHTDRSAAGDQDLRLNPRHSTLLQTVDRRWSTSSSPSPPRPGH